MRSNQIISSELTEKMNDNIDIKNCDEKLFVERAEEFTDLCRRSFAEHLEKNVKMGPGYMKRDKWIELSHGCIGQYIEDSGKIIAFWLVKPNFDKKEAYGRILAVDPLYKGNQLGLSLSLSLSNYLRDLGLNIFMTDTSLKAPHVVKFHKKYGCKAVGITSWSNTNYYTVILRLALNPIFEISDFDAKKRFLISSIRCKSLWKEDGNMTAFNKIMQPIKKLVSLFKH